MIKRRGKWKGPNHPNVQAGTGGAVYAMNGM